MPLKWQLLQQQRLLFIKDFWGNSHSKMDQLSISQILANYWSLAIVIISIAITWTKMGGKIDALSDRVKVLETGAERRDEILIEIRERLVSIETTLEIIKKK